MYDEIREYIKYLSNFNSITKPVMPNVDARAYTDNEYLDAVKQIENDFAYIDDLEVTLNFLKGE